MDTLWVIFWVKKMYEKDLGYTMKLSYRVKETTRVSGVNKTQG
jgi:hypothetical protein